MSDDAYSLAMALTCMALLAVLVLRFLQGRSLRRLLRSLDEQPPRPRNDGVAVSDHDFEIVSQLTAVDLIGAGQTIRELPRLIESYGQGPWRKLHGTATVRLRNGVTRRVQLHWYEGADREKKECKIARSLERP